MSITREQRLYAAGAGLRSLEDVLHGPCDFCSRRYRVGEHVYGIRTCCPDCSHDILAAEALLKLFDWFFFATGTQM